MTRKIHHAQAISRTSAASLTTSIEPCLKWLHLLQSSECEARPNSRGPAVSLGGKSGFCLTNKPSAARFSWTRNGGPPSVGGRDQAAANSAPRSSADEYR